MKKAAIIINLLFISFLFIQCSSTNNAMKRYEFEVTETTSNRRLIQNDIISLSESIGGNEIKRTIIYSANITISVNEPDNMSKSIKDIAKKYDGYVSEDGTWRAVIRVKRDNLDHALSDIADLGNVLNKSLYGEDITDEYYDYKIRLENAEKARDRYLELLKQAENVEAALLVEKELERLNGLIDLYKGKINRLEHLNQYSTITIKIKARKKPGILGYIGIGLYKSVKWLFVRN